MTEDIQGLNVEIFRNREANVIVKEKTVSFQIILANKLQTLHSYFLIILSFCNLCFYYA